MNTRSYGVLAALVGVVTGYITIHSPLHASWHSMILWIVVGLALLYFSKSRKAALLAGALFGFFDISSWLVFGFEGTSSQYAGISLLALGFGILGAICGLLGALVWSHIRSYFE